MKPEWIWLKEKTEAEKDIYTEFKSCFSKNGEGKVTLKVSCDSVFAAYLNGKLVGFSGCADYPHYKVYDELDITDYCKEENELCISVWYFGAKSQTYVVAPAGLWFKVEQGEKTLDASGEDTLSRVDRRFRQGYCKVITSQLGYSHYYDNTAVNTEEYLPSVKIDKKEPVKRPQKALVLEERLPVIYTERSDRLLIDMKMETAGFLDLDFESPCEQELLITFGEHLGTGEVSRFIGRRDFSIEFKAKKGRNEKLLPLRRIAGRYLEIHFEKAPVSPNYIGIRPVNYPVTNKPRKFNDPILQKIYDVSVKTLRLCMHEHYEDCPWREQALYALDSRNQMLFGYYAFKETEFPRSNLTLIGKGLREDGLLSICFPAGIDIPIPFFSLAYILACCEYVKYTGDHLLIEENEAVIDTIINTFSSRIGEKGLIPSFPYPFWNFYEWSKGSSDDIRTSPDAPYTESVDLILNCFYIYVLGIYGKTVGKTYDTASVADAVKRELYVKEKGLFKLSNLNSDCSQLGNALALLAGLGDKELAEKVKTGEGMIPATLSMKPFVYDALLALGDGYKEFILDDIKRVYKAMLDQDATSFWETEEGWTAFGNAGSLCHGWSASPVYYLNVLGCK